MSSGGEAARGGGGRVRATSVSAPGAFTPARFVQSAAALSVSVTEHEPLARHTTFRIGGPADLYAAATTVDQLEHLAELAAEHAVPAMILGGGSNVLVSDAGVRGLVIANQTRHHERRTPDGASIDSEQPLTRPQLIADSGVLLAGLARTAIKAGLSGLEWAVSVPGTVGGAVIGNAGAHGGDIAGNLAWGQVFYPGQGRLTLTVEQMAFAYRGSLLKRAIGGGGSAACSPEGSVQSDTWRHRCAGSSGRKLPCQAPGQPAGGAERRQHLPQPAGRPRGPAGGIGGAARSPHRRGADLAAPC